MNSALNSCKVIELLINGARYLDTCGVKDSRLDADILLAYLLGSTRDKLYLERDKVVPEEVKESYFELLCRRGQREPLAYIIKAREFMGLEFYVDHHVLIPRQETELLIEKVLEIGKDYYQDKIKILDLCTGSGAIAVSLAYYNPSFSIVAVDISTEALEVAKENAERMKVDVDFRQGDLFWPVKGEKFDIIVSNPPYVSEEEYAGCSADVKKEPSLALLGGLDGLNFYRRIAAEGNEYLSAGGKIILEIGCAQGTEVTNLLVEQGYRTMVFPDYAGLDRIVLAQKL